MKSKSFKNYLARHKKSEAQKEKRLRSEAAKRAIFFRSRKRAATASGGDPQANGR